MATRVPGTLRTPARPTIEALARATVQELAAPGIPVAGSCTIASWLGQLVLRNAGIEATPISVQCTVSHNGHHVRTATDESSFAGGHMILITHQPARLVDLSFGQFTGLPGRSVPAYLNVELDDPEVWPKAYGLPGGATVTYANPAALSPEEAADGEELVGLLGKWAGSNPESPPMMIVAWAVIAFYVWAVIYGLIFDQKGPTYEFLASLFRR